MSTPMFDTTRIMRSPHLPATSLGFGDVFGGAFKSVGRTWKTLLLLMLLQFAAIAAVGLVLAALIGFVFLGSLDSGQPSWIAIFGVAAGVLVVYVALLAVTARFSVATVAVFGIDLEGGAVSVGAAWQRTRGALGRMVVGVLIVMGLGLAIVLVISLVAAGAVASAREGSDTGITGLILGGVATYFLLWIVGIVVSIKLSFTWQVMAIEGDTLHGAWKRSWNLTNGAFWRILGYTLLFWLIASVVLIPLSAAFSGVQPTIDSGEVDFGAMGFLGVLGQIVYTALSFVLSAVNIAFITLMYVDQLRRQAGVGMVQAWYPNQGGGWSPGPAQPAGPYTQVPGQGQFGQVEYGQMQYGQTQYGQPQYGQAQYGQDAPSQPAAAQPWGAQSASEPTQEFGTESTQAFGTEPTQSFGAEPTQPLDDPWRRPADDPSSGTESTDDPWNDQRR